MRSYRELSLLPLVALLPAAIVVTQPQHPWEIFNDFLWKSAKIRVGIFFTDPADAQYVSPSVNKQQLAVAVRERIASKLKAVGYTPPTLTARIAVLIWDTEVPTEAQDTFLTGPDITIDAHLGRYAKRGALILDGWPGGRNDLGPRPSKTPLGWPSNMGAALLVPPEASGYPVNCFVTYSQTSSYVSFGIMQKTFLGSVARCMDEEPRLTSNLLIRDWTAKANLTRMAECFLRTTRQVTTKNGHTRAFVGAVFIPGVDDTVIDGPPATKRARREISGTLNTRDVGLSADKGGIFKEKWVVPQPVFDLNSLPGEEVTVTPSRYHFYVIASCPV